MAKLFIQSTDPDSGKMLVLEEDNYSIWAYILAEKGGEMRMEFDGFVCSVADPVELNVQPEDMHGILQQGNGPALMSSFANEYSYQPGLRKEDVDIVWKNGIAEIWLKKVLYLRMNTEEKQSFSKSLAKDGPYGFKLAGV